MLKYITPILLSDDDENNLPRALEALRYAHRTPVIDRGGTNKTLKICSSFRNEEVIWNAIDSPSKQCNFALAQGNKCPVRASARWDKVSER